MNDLTEKVDHLIACPQCDVLSAMPSVQEGHKVVCRRCGTKIFECKTNSIDRTLALAITGLLLAIPAMVLPIIGIGVVGLFNQASLVDSIFALFNKGYWLTALSIFLFTIAMPLIKLIAAAYITWSIKAERIKPSMLSFFRSYHHLDSWTMLHVFVLGVVVSMYKLVDMADLTVGLGFIAFIFLLLCSTLITITLDHHLIWYRLEQSLDNGLGQGSDD